MTPQERQLVDDLFERLARVEATPRDPDAAEAITQGLRIAPNATYALVQTVLLQDEALKRAHDRIQQLEGAGEPAQPRGGFLDSMRETILGRDQSQPRGSVPNVRPPDLGGRPVWNTGQVLGSTERPSDSRQDRPYNEPQGGQYGQPQPGQYGSYGVPQAPMGGGGGSFLGTAAAAAAGMVGGSLLLGSIRSMMGGNQHSFGDQSALGGGGGHSPWSGDQSGGNLARDAGLNDIGNNNGPSGHRADDSSSRQGMFDQASNDDHDDMDLDSDDFDGGGGDSDFA
ncbi:MAG: DUF2076 domain-containing protein [Rhodopseudomonas sp.]|uniref:DUF2076 domain-containing protein n=1 Tax=Rhodopseudomonas sp. TaxID=1078 RepID=UPI0017AB7EB3|nr:DUF2076 domain-containing protein [Rhodopseudomonas sp.]NVN85155.1 DUF2076 domain-containing protein [Rhodopseudomonas sp.]